jgi:hypothetical protein
VQLNYYITQHIVIAVVVVVDIIKIPEQCGAIVGGI